MSVASKVELYVSKRPYLREALAKGVINYSALARQICDAEEIDSFEAVKAALSRLEDHLSRVQLERREKVEEVLEKTSIKIEDGVKAIKSPQDQEAKVKAKTENGYTHIVEGGNKSLVTLVSPEKLEETPGVIEFILSSLAAEGINVDQLISCREDTHLVIDSKDASRTLELLQQRL